MTATRFGRRRAYRPHVLTWHVHGSYLYYLAHAPAEFHVPVKPGRPEGYGGRSDGLPWPDNVHEVPAEEAPSLELDCVLYQSRRNWTEDRYEILSPQQRRLPGVYLEHDPPREHPTDTRHWVDDPEVLVVHVTHFNDLMWDCGECRTRVVEHGVKVPPAVRYTGEIPRGLVVVNDIASRGRRLGADVLDRVRAEVPLDLAGMGSVPLGGLGEVSHEELPRLMAHYRFLFNPIRYTSLGLAVLEAMQCGVPVVGLATTEMAVAVRNGVSGYVDTDVSRLVSRMRGLIDDPLYARRLGEGARRAACRRWGIERFAREWGELLSEVAERRPVAV
ncbi:MAG: glycosyltransferase family 4 protein [Coriobacteriia bacterium]|nr:glycosyltransferase family 4 protein [Coriobacteriia bacterium]